MHYSSLFQYFLSMCYSPYTLVENSKFFCVLVEIEIRHTLNSMIHALATTVVRRHISGQSNVKGEEIKAVALTIVISRKSSYIKVFKISLEGFGVALKAFWA